MNIRTKEDMLKSINLAHESLKNSMQVFLESYIEVMTKLDFVTQIILKDNVK